MALIVKSQTLTDIHCSILSFMTMASDITQSSESPAVLPGPPHLLSLTCNQAFDVNNDTLEEATFRGQSSSMITSSLAECLGLHQSKLSFLGFLLSRLCLTGLATLTWSLSGHILVLQTLGQFS